MLPENYQRALLHLLLFGICVGVAIAGPKPEMLGIEAGQIAVNATRISSFKRFGGADEPLAKLTFRGGLVLTSASPQFGGWSGLIMDDEAKSFLAISDTGVWLTARLAYDGNHPAAVEDGRLGPLLDRRGRPIGGSFDRDSESVALESGTFQQGSVLVGFESRHRIERYGLTTSGLSADQGPVPLPPDSNKMRHNQGLEGLTVMKGGPYKGSLVAFSERLYDASRNHTGWLWTGQGPETIHLKNVGDFDVTDLASLDDGTLFVLERRFRWLEGVKMRLRRISPEELGPGRTVEGETLIEADLNDEIDNMEGLSVTRLKSGEVLVTLISDDNFNPVLQRTILLQFTVERAEQAIAPPLNWLLTGSRLDIDGRTCRSSDLCGLRLLNFALELEAIR